MYFYFETCFTPPASSLDFAVQILQEAHTNEAAPHYCNNRAKAQTLPIQQFNEGMFFPLLVGVGLFVGVLFVVLDGNCLYTAVHNYILHSMHEVGSLIC